MTESGIGEKEIDLRIKILKEDAKKRGYNLNTDELLVRELVSGILINKKRYGFESCPCRLTIGKKEDNIDIICPCDYREQDISEYGCCYCALYVSEDVEAKKKTAEPIPDRRFERQDSENHKVPDNCAGIKNLRLKYPIFRCRVCGYLCARENPPQICPICKAVSEKFEKYL
ncbi:MAG: ferredoxin:glutaredoxin reductase [Methanomicrobiaceae archaeon]|nr:ferredoxin:glutaredoxin reductase [Methanomicrobiaceae archaeon]